MDFFVEWDQIAERFSKIGLSAPPIPLAFRNHLFEVTKFGWSTRTELNPRSDTQHGLRDVYDLEPFVNETALAPLQNPYAFVTLMGHGINSYFLSLAIVSPPLAIFTKHPFGGVYMKGPEYTEAVEKTWSQIEILLAAVSEPSEIVRHVMHTVNSLGSGQFFYLKLEPLKIEETPLHVGDKLGQVRSIVQRIGKSFPNENELFGYINEQITHEFDIDSPGMDDYSK